MSIFGKLFRKIKKDSIVKKLVSSDEATFLDGLREAVSFAPKGDATGLEAMKDAIRRRAGQRDAKLYEPGVSVRSGSDIMAARSQLRDLAARKALLSDPYQSGNLITAFVSVSDSQEQQRLLQEIFAVGGDEQGYIFQLLFNQMRASAVLAAAKRA